MSQTQFNPYSTPLSLALGYVTDAQNATADAAIKATLQSAIDQLKIVDTQMQSVAGARDAVQQQADTCATALADANKKIAWAKDRLDALNKQCAQAQATNEAIKASMPPAGQTYVTAGAAAGFAAAGLILGGLGGYFIRGAVESKAKGALAAKGAKEQPETPEPEDTEELPVAQAQETSRPKKNKKKKKKVVKEAA